MWIDEQDIADDIITQFQADIEQVGGDEIHNETNSKFHRKLIKVHVFSANLNVHLNQQSGVTHEF